VCRFHMFQIRQVSNWSCDLHWLAFGSWRDEQGLDIPNPCIEITPAHVVQRATALILLRRLALQRHGLPVYHPTPRLTYVPCPLAPPPFARGSLSYLSNSLDRRSLYPESLRRRGLKRTPAWTLARRPAQYCCQGKAAAILLTNSSWESSSTRSLSTMARQQPWNQRRWTARPGRLGFQEVLIHPSNLFELLTRFSYTLTYWQFLNITFMRTVSIGASQAAQSILRASCIPGKKRKSAVRRPPGFNMPSPAVQTSEHTPS
jgi:hypothetical protein